MHSNISIWVIYKVVTLLVGLLCIFMGYKLLMKGIFDGGSDITAAWDNNRKLIIRRASPGVIFALVGFGIIAINFTVSSYSFQARGDIRPVVKDVPVVSNQKNEGKPVIVDHYDISQRSDSDQSEPVIVGNMHESANSQ